MPVLILILFIGFLVGRVFSDNSIIRFSGKLITPIVLILLFFMGALTGANETLLADFATLGANAMVIVVGSLIGTIFLSVIFGRVLKRKLLKNQSR